jgi:hypothetical protein
VLLHIHCAVADSVCGTLVGSLSATILCLCAIASAVAVLCSQSILISGLKSISILRLKQIAIGSFVDVGLYWRGKESSGQDAYD